MVHAPVQGPFLVSDEPLIDEPLVVSDKPVLDVADAASPFNER